MIISILLGLHYFNQKFNKLLNLDNKPSKFIRLGILTIVFLNIVIVDTYYSSNFYKFFIEWYNAPWVINENLIKPSFNESLFYWVKDVGFIIYESGSELFSYSLTTSYFKFQSYHILISLSLFSFYSFYWYFTVGHKLLKNKIAKFLDFLDKRWELVYNKK